MTITEFWMIEPYFARELLLAFGHCVVDGVYSSGNRWEAHLSVPPRGEFEIVYEAQCLPNCRRGSGGRFVWVTESHVCCVACEADPSHHYQTVHE